MITRLSAVEREVLARTVPDPDDLERVAAVVEAIMLSRARARLHPAIVERRWERDYELMNS